MSDKKHSVKLNLNGGKTAAHQMQTYALTPGETRSGVQPNTYTERVRSPR